MAHRRRFVVGLIGSDLGPSLSPPLHEQEADELGVRYLYQLIDLDVLGLGAEDVGDLVSQARRFGFAGLNITHPCKQTVVKYLDELSPEAAELGAVNTVVFDGERAIGHNTDWSGFLTGFQRGLPDVAVRDVVLLGAGGAGTAVAFALVRLGARHLTVVDVMRERAERLAAVVQNSIADDSARVTIEVAHTVQDVLDRLAGADGLVNATPVGMSGERVTPLPAALLHPRMWVADIVYRPLETQLLRQAREIGCRTLDGGGMVVAQAAEAFRLITGLAPDAERMHRHFHSLTSPSTT
ncbi:shikimate dehydrogenase (NADP(+)) [Rhizocola hellebori]|uniref:Shikimate dehydrogenase (NADP(+)) n=1 Tax=Rhizocola hellebori TaxID=1392758 RepID=A0A8J3Q822_9ACTN|nr:shikimate dehydrogenase [Rhizocola hellebori]GIH04942.1 shikimate dehydrogenase (NADP(+)) [Rhizocola hellebori]